MNQEIMNKSLIWTLFR